MHSPQAPSTKNMFDFQALMIQYLSTSINQNSALGLIWLLELWMGHISIAAPQQKTDTQQETGKAVYVKTALPVVHLK